MVNNRTKNFMEISKDEAKELYCKYKDVYVDTDERTKWKLPPSREYASHAPIEELFYRGIPTYEGNVIFYKVY